MKFIFLSKKKKKNQRNPQPWWLFCDSYVFTHNPQEIPFSKTLRFKAREAQIKTNPICEICYIKKHEHAKNQLENHDLINKVKENTDLKENKRNR